MRFVLFGLMLICLSSGILANEVVGQIRLSVLNSPPMITSLDMEPGKAYPDSSLACIPVVQDERPSEVEYDIIWEVNGMAGAPENLREGDVVKCIVTPKDIEGEIGPSKSAQTTIMTPSLSLKITKQLVNAFGAEADYERSAELQSQGLASVTGFVVKEGIGETNLAWTLVVIAFILLLLNLNIIMRHRMRTVRSRGSS